MSYCKHCQWVDILQRDLNFSISYSARVQHVLQGLPNPSFQFPTVSYFIGKRAKVSALQALFPDNNITRRQAHGIGNLHIVSNTSGSRYPVLFVDCTPGAECINQIGSWTGCHELKRFRLRSWVTRSIARSSLIDQIQAQLLFLFVDVICIFVDDVGAATEQLIQKWVATRLLVQGGPKPKLLIVSQSAQRDFGPDNISRWERSPNFQAHFESVKYVFPLRLSCSAIPFSENWMRAVSHG